MNLHSIGERQTGTIGVALKPFMVSIVTNDGPLQGTPITFKLVRGRGAFIRKDAVTDNQGRAMAIFVPYSDDYTIVCYRSEELYIVFQGTAAESRSDTGASQAMVEPTDAWLFPPEDESPSLPTADDPAPSVHINETPAPLPLTMAPTKKRSGGRILVGFGLVALLAVLIATIGLGKTDVLSATTPKEPLHAQPTPPRPRILTANCGSPKTQRKSAASRIITCPVIEQ